MVGVKVASQKQLDPGPAGGGLKVAKIENVVSQVERDNADTRLFLDVQRQVHQIMVGPSPAFCCIDHPVPVFQFFPQEVEERIVRDAERIPNGQDQRALRGAGALEIILFVVESASHLQGEKE
jgi:hypothetical protein